MKLLLDNDLNNKLRETVNSDDLFWKDPVQKENWNLICAVMDRLDTSINYINSHTDYSKNENDIILFFVHASIIKDAIYQVSNALKIDCSNTENIFYKYVKDYEIFENVEEYENYRNSKNAADDQFYEYLRSLVFAHPAETSWSIPNRIQNEIQYSPYLLSSTLQFHCDYKNPIGVQIYSNKRDIFHICLDLDDLKQYVKNKYYKLELIINKYNSIVEEFKKEKKKHKVNRNQDDLSILKEIVTILDERYLEHYDIDKLINDLECNLTVAENRNNVELFRNQIKKIIPNLCDAVDKYDCDSIYSLCDVLLYSRPKAHQMMNYQLEKIFCYLNDDGYGDIEWGLIQAEAFSKEFAKKWVVIKPYDMSFKEIKLLANVACYLEYQEQNKESKNE